MGKVIFSVSYEIIPEKRDNYLVLMKKIKEQIKSTENQDYTLYEDAERPNLMTEVYFLENQGDSADKKEIQEKQTESLMSQIEQFVVNQEQVAIRTFNEII